MKQRELLEILRQKKVFNIFDILPKGSFIIYFSSKESVIPARWILKCIGKAFSNAPWYDNGGKSFSGWGKKKDALEEAKQFGLTLGVKEWIKTPWKDVWAEKDKYEEALKKVLEDN